MITRLDVNDYATLACNLITVSLADFDKTPQSETDEYLKFALGFIQEKIGEIRNGKVSLAAMEDGPEEHSYRRDLSSQLVVLERAIRAVLDAKPDHRKQALDQLIKDTKGIEAEADEFRLRMSNSYPGIASKRPSCPGFRGPVEVLHAIKENQKRKASTS